MRILNIFTEKHSENQRSFLALMSMLSLSNSCLISRDTFPQSSGSEPGTIAVSAESTQPACLNEVSEHSAMKYKTWGVVLTCVSYDLFPRLLGEDVKQQWRDEGCERPQPHCAVSATAGHGERTTLMTCQTYRHVHRLVSTCLYRSTAGRGLRYIKQNVFTVC